MNTYGNICIYICIYMSLYPSLSHLPIYAIPRLPDGPEKRAPKQAPGHDDKLETCGLLRKAFALELRYSRWYCGYA